MAECEHTASSGSLRLGIHNQVSELDANLETSLAAARRERENLQSRLHDYKCPILTLPVEITSEIFIIYLPVYPECPPMAGFLSPALLGQVCGHWRAIAFETPSLWRAIKLDIRYHSSLDARLIALKTWLLRSKRCSLSLALEKSYSPIFRELPHFTDTMRTHSARLEYIKLIVPLDEFDCLEGPFPLLRQLILVPIPLAEGPPAQTLFDDAPQLRSVVLGRSFNRSHMVLPWSQLTSIAGENIPTGRATEILREATGIVNLRCSLLQEDIGVPIALPALPPLVHLESLILHNAASGTGNTQKLLLDALTAPALRHLLVSECELGDQPISTITSLLSRSHCSLESLHVTHSWMCTAADYRAVFPSIKVIDVSSLDTDDSSDEDEEDEDEGSDESDDGDD
ncbi:hypothetical protein C8J57DRAFT_1480508 [Mycena rebaudengoi]|nr:hypothetical protein C8J57DRAFT_1480508 [Mycena rebaudengoi]